jgi:hypothetical protein
VDYQAIGFNCGFAKGMVPAGLFLDDSK